MNEHAITGEAILRMFLEILSMPVALELDKPKNTVNVLSRQPMRYIFHPGYQAFNTSIVRSFLQSICAYGTKVMLFLV